MNASLQSSGRLIERLVTTELLEQCLQLQLSPTSEVLAQNGLCGSTFICLAIFLYAAAFVGTGRWCERSLLFIHQLRRARIWSSVIELSRC